MAKQRTIVRFEAGALDRLSGLMPKDQFAMVAQHFMQLIMQSAPSGRWFSPFTDMGPEAQLGVNARFLDGMAMGNA
jgi:hypothetical protein